MKISTKTWCQLPSALSKGICVAVVSLCLCGMPTMVSASQTQSSVEQTPSKVLLKGKIVDEAGKPVAGASVSVKNTTIGMSTNRAGEFALSVPNEKMTLVVSFIGFEKVEKVIVAPANEKELNIMLKEEELSADEVVVNGFTTNNKATFTGTYTTIKKEEFQKVSPTNLMQAISVFEPSFRLVENIEMGSDPNTMPEAYLRGQSGMSNRQLDVAETVSPYAANTNPNLPIFILDGFEISLEKFNDLDPNLVESITILKDAQATALYGSRASNGVLIITSVPPQPGQLRFTYAMTASISAPDLTDYHLLNAEEKLAQEVKANQFAGLSGYSKYIAKANNVARGVDTYWLSIPLRTQFNQTHSLSMSGGSDEFRFALGLRYQNENGVMKDSYRNVYGANMSLTYHLPGLQISNAVSVNVMERENSPYGSYATYTKMLPYESPYDLETGKVVAKFRLQKDQGSGSGIDNPLYDVSITDNKDFGTYTEFTNNFMVNWNPFHRLSLKGQFSVTKKDEKTEKFVDPNSAKYGDPNFRVEDFDDLGNSLGTIKPSLADRGDLTLTNMSTVNWDAKFQASFNNNWDKHFLSATAGINATGSKSNHHRSQFRGFPSAELSDPKYAAKEMGRQYFDDNINRLFGVLVTANYSYDNTYMFDMSLRWDGSSQFGSDNKFAHFFSFGTGVNMHNWEYFKNNLPAISQARLRVNYGQTGNVTYPPHAVRSTYEIVLGKWHTHGLGANLIALGNKNLSWETTHTVNVGVDVNLWNRLNVELNWYNKLTKDLLTDVTLPYSAGFTSYKDNMGEVENRGWEFSVKYKVLETKEWGVDVFVNGAHNKGTIKKISDSTKEYNDRVNEHFNTTALSTGSGYHNKFGVAVGKPVLKYEEGGSLTAIYGMQSLGISPATGDELYLDLYGNPTFTWSGDHQRIIGNSEPDLQGSFGLSFRWKNFDVFTTFSYQVGADQYNSTLVDRVENLDYMNYNCDERIMEDRWHKQGDVTKYKDVNDTNTATRPTSRFLMKNNYINFGSLNVNYNFDNNSNWMKGLGISMLRLSFNMSDIVRFSTIQIERGLSYPFARTFNLSLNASF